MGTLQRKIARIAESIVWSYRLRRRMNYLRGEFRNGDELAASLLRKSVCDVAICHDGVTLKHPAGRTGLAGLLVEVWFEQVYTKGFYKPRDEDVIIDAGANIGTFSISMFLCNPLCKVYAYEPFLENFSLLVENLSSFNATSVTPLPIAVTGEKGVAVIHSIGCRSQDHRVERGISGSPEDFSVPTYGLGDVIAEAKADQISLFKCDIEGSEYGLFLNAHEDDLRRVSNYAIEYHDHIIPGTKEMILKRLDRWFSVVVKEDLQYDYGMIFAKRKLRA